MVNNYYIGDIHHNKTIKKDAYTEKLVLYSDDKYNYLDLINDINYSLQQMFTTLINSEIILGYEGLSVKRDIENPMQINISFFIEAIYPLNFIEIKFGFSTTISE